MKHIEKGINPSSVGQIYFTGDYLLKGIRIGVVACMIALTVSKSFERSTAQFLYILLDILP